MKIRFAVPVPVIELSAFVVIGQSDYFQGGDKVGNRSGINRVRIITSVTSVFEMLPSVCQLSPELLVETLRHTLGEVSTN